MPRPMTVKQLIEKLDKLNPSLRVFVAGRQGFSNPLIGEPELMALNVRPETSKYGAHEIARLWSMSQNGGNIDLQEGVILW